MAGTPVDMFSSFLIPQTPHSFLPGACLSYSFRIIRKASVSEEPPCPA